MADNSSTVKRDERANRTGFIRRRIIYIYMYDDVRVRTLHIVRGNLLRLRGETIRSFVYTNNIYIYIVHAYVLKRRFWARLPDRGPVYTAPIRVVETTKKKGHVSHAHAHTHTQARRHRTSRTGEFHGRPFLATGHENIEKRND